MREEGSAGNLGALATRVARFAVQFNICEILTDFQVRRIS